MLKRFGDPNDDLADMVQTGGERFGEIVKIAIKEFLAQRGDPKLVSDDTLPAGWLLLHCPASVMEKNPTARDVKLYAWQTAGYAAKINPMEVCIVPFYYSRKEKWYTLVTPKGREYLAAEAGKVCAICVHTLPLATARA